MRYYFTHRTKCGCCERIKKEYPTSVEDTNTVWFAGWLSIVRWSIGMAKEVKKTPTTPWSISFELCLPIWVGKAVLAAINMVVDEHFGCASQYCEVTMNKTKQKNRHRYHCNTKVFFRESDHFELVEMSSRWKKNVSAHILHAWH